MHGTESSFDEWPYRFRNLRGAFINDHLGTTIMIAKGLPQDPMVFTMAHELKHFFRDRDLGILHDQSNLNKSLEVERKFSRPNCSSLTEISSPT